MADKMTEEKQTEKDQTKLAQAKLALAGEGKTEDWRKKTEEFERLNEIQKYYKEHPPRGEICLLIPAGKQTEIPIDLEKIKQETIALIESGIDRKEAFKMKALEYKIKKSVIYNMLINE